MKLSNTTFLILCFWQDFRAVCYKNAICALFSLYQATYSKMRKPAEKIFRAEERSQKIKKTRLITSFSDDIEGRPAKVIAFYFLLLLASRERLCFVMGVESCNFFSWREATTCIMLAYVVDILNLNLFLGWTRFRARYLLSFFLFGKWSVITFKMLQHQERKKCDSLCIAVFFFLCL